MGSPFKAFSRLIANRPRSALVVLFAITIGLASGFSLLGQTASTEAFLPDESEVAAATDTLAEAFPDSAGLTNITIIHRGDALTPQGLDHIDRVTQAVLSLESVTGQTNRLALTDPVLSLANVYKQALGVNSLANVSQSQIDTASAALANDPGTGPIVAMLSGEAGGEGLTISQIRLRSLEDSEGLETAELDISGAVAAVEGPLSVRSLSTETINKESEEALASFGILMLIALGVIAVLLMLFFRAVSDVLLSLLGLGITIIGTLGFQGLAGPDGLGWIGLPNSITTMVPIMLVGLVVDYAIQSVARYRELRAEGKAVREAVGTGLWGVLLPLGLAAGTTIVSFMTNTTSPIPANRDFGVVAAFGVFFGLLTMLVLIPATRSILDQRKEAKGVLQPPRLLNGAIPGAGRLVERIGALVSNRPMPVLAVTMVVTGLLGLAATGISTEFSTNDFLPAGGESIQDIEDLEEALGGQTEVVTVLAEAELTDDRVLRNLVTIGEAFNDDLSKPTGAVGSITISLGDLVTDWTVDSGEPGDKFDQELLELTNRVDLGLTLDPVVVNEILERMRELDPVAFGQVAVNNQDGLDKTLVQFSALTGDQDRTEQLVADVEGLWYGDREQVVTTSGEIVSLEVTSSLTESQSSSIVITIISALIALTLFFWFTEFRPMLAVIAVFPIGLVLIWVLGTMSLLGISYNLITALITALSIGIGVDYTIHIIHRFTEEIEHGRSLVEATKVTLSTTGSALIGSAVTTALAFAVLLFSPLLPFQQFGIVTGITILYALIVSVVVVPPMLLVWAAYHQWRREGGMNYAPGAREASPAATTPATD